MAQVREIRADQETRVREVEAQLEAGAKWIQVGNRLIRPEPAWAATQALRGCWERGLRYEGQSRDANGYWQGRGTYGTGGLVLFPLGKFPG